MKKGKIILGAAAALVTIGSSFAFKVANKFNVTPAFVQVTSSGANLTCKTCTNVFRTGASTTQTACLTIGSGLRAGAGLSHHTFFQSKGNNVTCVNPTIKTSEIQ